MEQVGVKNDEQVRREWENRSVEWLGHSFDEYKAARYGAKPPAKLDAAPDALVAMKAARMPHSAGVMNKLETRYANHLDMLKRLGDVRSYDFEPMKLKLAKSTFFNVDFLVWMKDGTVELHEVKGHWEDDARVKIKVAARQFPYWRFKGVQWDRTKKDWKYEVFDA